MDRLGSRQLSQAVRGAGASTSTVAGGADPSSSLLAERLLLLVGWGLISTNTARWLAEGAVADTDKPRPAILQLAQLGNFGKWAGNCRRDLFRTFCPTMTSPKPIHIQVPMKNKRGAIVWEDTLVVNPLAHLEHLYRTSREKFDSFIGSGISDFWSRVRADDPRFLAISDRLTAKPDWKRRAIPYMIHGDGGTFTTTGESLMVVSMKCLLSFSFAAGAIIPLWTCVKSCKVGKFAT